MPRLTTIQTNFASGEVDPLLHGQVDLKVYANGAKRLRNVQRRATGGVERRGGTYDLTNAIDGRLAEFEFSDTERYLLLFINAGVRIYSIDGVLVTTVGGAPWTLAQAKEMTYTQNGDVMVITHQAFQTRILRRTSATTFTISLLPYDRSITSDQLYQPYFKFEGPSTWLKVNAVTGAATVTSNVGFFNANYVGTRLKIYGTELFITGYISPTQVNADILGRLEGSYDLDPFKTTAGSTTVEVLHLFHGFDTGQSITISGANSAGGIAGASLNGAHVVTVLDDNRYTFVAGAAATDSEDGGGPNVKYSVANAETRQWMEAALSTTRGWPGSCAFHEQRLWLGGSPSLPDAYFGSKSTFPFNFSVGQGYDGDSVQGTIGSEDVSRIRHIVSNGELQLLTPLKESIFLVRDGEPITPTNQRVKSQTSMGTGALQPAVFDGSTLFVQENGLSVSELNYSSEAGGYVSVPVSTIAGHLIGRPVSLAVSLGTTARSEQLAFFVNSTEAGEAGGGEDLEGTVTVFHSLRSENIAGWVNWALGAGMVRSVATVGPYVYFLVEVRGAFRIYRMADEKFVTLDGAVWHTNPTPQTAWVLDPRVRGRTVHLVSDRGYLGEVEVPPTGEVETIVPVSNLLAGDAFYGLIETLSPVLSVPAGVRVGKVQRIVNAAILFKDAHAMVVDGAAIETRPAISDFSLPAPPLNGHYETGQLGYSRDPTMIITQNAPLYFCVLALTMEVNV